MGRLRFDYEENDNLYRDLGFRYNAGGGDCYFVYDEDGKDNEELVGVVWVIHYDQSDYDCLDEDVVHLDLVEVLAPGNGYGTRIVDELFNVFEVRKIKGQVMYDSDQVAYYFWESMGARMFSVSINEDDDEEFREVENVDDFIYEVKHMLEDVEFEYTKK